MWLTAQVEVHAEGGAGISGGGGFLGWGLKFGVGFCVLGGTSYRSLL